MISTLILVFVGGAVGAMLREFLMLGVPPVDGFPLDIFGANVMASFLLGLATALHARKVITDEVNTLLGTGVMGGLSTFSSFVYASVVLMAASRQSAVIAVVYVLVSLVVGYGAVILGQWIGRGRARPA